MGELDTVRSIFEAQIGDQNLTAQESFKIQVSRGISILGTSSIERYRSKPHTLIIVNSMISLILMLEQQVSLR